MRNWRRFSRLTVLTFVAGSLVWSAVMAAPGTSKKTDAPQTAAATDDKNVDTKAAADMNAAADKGAAGGESGLREPKDPPPARLKIQDNFSVDQPVTKELLAALNAKRPAGRPPVKPAAARSADPVMDLPVAK
jgi:hypothetical protein